VALDAQWSAVARGYRLALVLAGLVGVAALAVCTLTGYPLAGFFISVGLGLGGWNSRRLWTDTEKLVDGTQKAGEKWRGPAVAASARRLGLITVIAFLVALAYRPLGWTVFLGLVMFHTMLMALLANPLRKVVRL
jgi:predicted membrane protein